MGSRTNTSAEHHEHNPLLRQEVNCKSLRAVIRAQCAECVGCTSRRIESGFKADVHDCASRECPLHPVRPHQVMDAA